MCVQVPVPDFWLALNTLYRSLVRSHKLVASNVLLRVKMVSLELVKNKSTMYIPQGQELYNVQLC